MDLRLKPEKALVYKSPSQRARVLTENWVEENMYCPACPEDRLNPAPKGEPVVDFICPSCNEPYQLKSQRRPFGNRVTDSAYEPKIEAIRTGTIPNFLFLQYNARAMMVQNLFLVPRHFMSQSIIERRKPLSERARRRGWVGSSILLGHLPLDAQIQIIDSGHELPKSLVRSLWNRFLFLREQTVYSRGWLADVLACVRQLDQEIFTLQEVYKFEKHLAELHPRNKHIRPKIRQQLQILRDYGIIEFLGKGIYRVKKL